jgi:ferritin-like metal-binding protein YciE
MTQELLRELFIDTIRDLYDAEKQLTKALPKLAKAASNQPLADAIEEHLRQTTQHVSRLEDVFHMMQVPVKGKPCKGMKGLIEEGGEAAEEHDDSKNLTDLAIISAAQRVEHYEISAYGTARTIAERLGQTRAAELLRKTENEEANADKTLTKVAMSLYDAEDEPEHKMALVGAHSNRRSTPARRRHHA